VGKRRSTPSRRIVSGSKRARTAKRKSAPRTRGVRAFLKDVFRSWSADDGPRMAAGLAFYTTFSVGPLLLIAVGIAGLVFGQESARREILGQMGALAGPEGAEAVRTILEGTQSDRSGSILATVLGGAALLFGASGVFLQLQDALNRIWNVEKRSGRGVKGFVMDRLLSFGMVMGIAFLLLVSLVFHAVLQAVELKALTAAITFVVVALLFAATFKVLPDAKTRWRDVLVGGAVTALLFTLGKVLIGLYLGQSATASKYGAFGSLVVFMLWIYYSAQIFTLGGEFTQRFATWFGRPPVPDEDAQPQEA
jgi:membrane protein